MQSASLARGFRPVGAVREVAGGASEVEGPVSEPRTETPASGGGDVPIPALPLADVGFLGGVLAALAGSSYRIRAIPWFRNW